MCQTHYKTFWTVFHHLQNLMLINFWLDLESWCYKMKLLAKIIKILFYNHLFHHNVKLRLLIEQNLRFSWFKKYLIMLIILVELCSNLETNFRRRVIIRRRLLKIRILILFKLLLVLEIQILWKVENRTKMGQATTNYKFLKIPKTKLVITISLDNIILEKQVLCNQHLDISILPPNKMRENK